MGSSACEKPLCRSLVDQDDFRRCRRITAVEETARADRNPHRLEVVRADDPHRRRRHRCRVRLGLVVTTEPGDDIEIARERQPACDGRRFHSGFRLQSREERRHECVEVRGRRILRGRKRQTERRDAFRIESRLNALQLQIAANEQARADQQHGGKRELRDDQQSPSSRRALPNRTAATEARKSGG